MKYQELRDALAARPTPGPWTHESIDESQFGIRNQAGEVIAQTQQLVGDTRKMDQRHINTRYVATVDPDTLRALIAERDALQSALKWMVQRADEGGYPDGKCLQEARTALSQGEQT